MPGQRKHSVKSKRREKAAVRFPVLPLTRSKTALLANYEVWRKEMEKTNDINETCRHLNITLDTLNVIIPTSSPDVTANTRSFSPVESVKTLLEDCVQPERNDTAPKEIWMEKGDTLPARTQSDDLNANPKSEEVTPKQDRPKPEEKLQGLDTTRCESESSLQRTKEGSLKKYESSIFVPSLKNDQGPSVVHTPSMSRAEANLVRNLERRDMLRSLVEECRFDLTYSSYSNLPYALLSKIFCNLRDFLIYVYDII